MDFKLNDKVYGYYNSQYYCIEGRIVLISSDVNGNFHIGKLYGIKTDNGIFRIPEKQVFSTYEQWKEYFETKS